MKLLSILLALAFLALLPACSKSSSNQSEEGFLSAAAGKAKQAAALLPVASAITPVPGGVGPMTITMLLHNTLLAANRRTANP